MGITASLTPVPPDELAALRRDPAAAFARVTGPGAVSLEKLWHAIHFLLTGAAEPVDGPLGQAIFGGEPLGDPHDEATPRLLAPADVGAIAAALAELGAAELRRRFVPAQLERAGIYPSIWGEDEDALFVEVHGYYAAMAAAYGEAAARGCGMLLLIA